MALTERKIRQIIREELILAEATRLAKDSADNQIDSIIIGFEEQSKVVESVRRRLREADEEKKDEEQSEDAGQVSAADVEKPEDGSASSVDSSEREVDEPADPNKPKIDIDQFTSHIARFVQNFDSMLDIKSVIVERAKKFLNESYQDPGLISKFDELLRHDHDIQPTGYREELPPAPAAVGAGPGGA